jgi:hypothetical protein
MALRRAAATDRKTKTRKTTTRRTAAKSTAKPAAAALAHSKGWRALRASSAMLGGMSRCTGLVVEPQQQTQWCWAAVSKSLSHYYDPGSSWTQCMIVDAELGQTTCCTAGGTASCNQPWYLDLALTRVGNLQSATSGTLSFSTLQSETMNNHPPCARQGWAGGGGHFVAIVCCYQFRSLAMGTTSTSVGVSDPWYGDSIVDYATFVSGYMGTGMWTHSYLTQP